MHARQSQILGTVAAEADRMEDSDPTAWSKHAEPLDSLVADFYYVDGCIEALDQREADAVSFLIEGMDWESIMDPCERDGEPPTTYHRLRFHTLTILDG